MPTHLSTTSAASSDPAVSWCCPLRIVQIIFVLQLINRSGRALPGQHRRIIRNRKARELRRRCRRGTKEFETVASFEQVQLFGQRPSPAYRYVPFLMIERDLSPVAFSWKLMARLPFSARDLLARAMSGRPFYPGEDDYCFDPDHTEGAHALLALAQ